LTGERVAAELDSLGRRSNRNLHHQTATIIQYTKTFVNTQFHKFNTQNKPLDAPSRSIAHYKQTRYNSKQIPDPNWITRSHTA
jgi:hypothetical protein